MPKSQQRPIARRPAHSQPVRLYTKGTVLGYRRLVAQYPQWSLVRIEGVKDRNDVDFYLGKRVAFIYKVQNSTKTGSHTRVIWGKVAKPHGNNGVVRARFATNLPPKAQGAHVRVMLFPSRV